MSCNNVKLLVLFVLVTIYSGISAQTLTPVRQYGQLKVSGSQILDQHGNPVQLRGVSFFWSQWMDRFYNPKIVDWLVDDWKVTIVRAAMGVKHEPSLSGYLYDGSEADRVKVIVDAALRKGIYVIIDWHDHYAFNNLRESKKFFSKMASRYGKYPNVIYEIFNEPIDVSWLDTVKPYSEEVISTIRAVDPDNLIIIGSPHWCQDVDSVALNPIKGENLVYALHYYSSTHNEDLRKRAQAAIDKNLPLFVSEFGVSLASGDGYIDTTESNNWFTFLDKYHISWCNWSIGDKDESSSALIPGARYYGKWKNSELTLSGKYIRNKCRLYAGIKDSVMSTDEKNVKKRWLTIKPIN